MLHYHVWFNLKPTVPEQEGLQAVSDFLTELTKEGAARGVHLLRNSGRPPRSRLPVFHALVQFADQAGLDAAMANQARRGIHQGAHGRMIDVVCDFHVEVFSSVEFSAEIAGACEI